LLEYLKIKLDTDLKIIMWDISSMINKIIKNFDTSILFNYFDGLIKLFSDLYSVKFLDTSAQNYFFRTKQVLFY